MVKNKQKIKSWNFTKDDCKEEIYQSLSNKMHIDWDFTLILSKLNYYNINQYPIWYLCLCYQLYKVCFNGSTPHQLFTGIQSLIFECPRLKGNKNINVQPYIYILNYYTQMSAMLDVLQRHQNSTFIDLHWKYGTHHQLNQHFENLNIYNLTVTLLTKYHLARQTLISHFVHLRI